MRITTSTTDWESIDEMESTRLDAGWRYKTMMLDEFAETDEVRLHTGLDEMERKR